MNLALLQARMGSTRLPGKVLKELNGIPLIQTLINRVSGAKCIDKLAVVTSTNSEDDALEKYCNEHGVLVFRGSDWDVLDRFYSAAKFFEAKEGDNIIRLTSDCPTHHRSTVDWVYTQFVKYGVDLFSNSNEEPYFLEDGFDVEVVKFSVLEDAFQHAKLHSEREHVIPYVKNSKKFTLGFRKMNDNCNFKLSVDTPSDFDFVEALFTEFGSSNFNINDVVHLLESKPELLKLNEESIINAGYAKSLREDKIVK